MAYELKECKYVNIGGVKYPKWVACQKLRVTPEELDYLLEQSNDSEEWHRLGLWKNKEERFAEVRRLGKLGLKRYFKYKTRLFYCKEGLMAYAGAFKWKQVADEVEEVYLPKPKKE